MMFVDADFFIGLYHKDDLHHQKCKNLYTKINTQLVTSSDVLEEVVRKLQEFASKELAMKFLNTLINGKIKIVYPTQKLFSEARPIFTSQTSKKVSMTDCMNMAIAKSLGITTFLSSDKVYEKNGFILFS